MLDSDLNCSGAGLQIGGNGIDLDLNGYTINGGRFGPGIRGFQGFGPRDLTIHGGTIRNFEFAIYLERAADSRISNLTIDGTDGLTLNGPEVIIRNPTNVAFEDNEVIGAAITFEEGSWHYGEESRPGNNRIERNIVRGTGFFNGQISLRRLDRNVVKDNTVSGGLISIVGDIEANQGADENLIEGNHVTGSPQGYAILLAQDCVRNEVSGNEVSGGFNGIMVTVDCENNSVTGNEVHDVSQNGIIFSYIGYRSRANLAESNVVHDNGVDGIVLSPQATESIVRNNVAYANGDDGIEAGHVTDTVTGNTAYGNLDWGIEAVAGVTDGGGNRAWSNGQLLQCLNVACELPPSTDKCKVGGNGRGTADNGDRASLQAHIKVSGSKVRGDYRFADRGPSEPLTVRPLTLVSLVCDPSGEASLFGEAQVGSSSYLYQLDLSERSRSQRRGSFRIRLSSGYDSGDVALEQGHIVIRTR